MAETAGRARFWPRALAITFAVLAILLVGAFGFLGFTRAGTSVILNLAAPVLNSADTKITISGAGPLLTGHLRADRVTVADAKGVYAEIDGIAADWSPLDLLGLKANIELLTATRIRLERLPESSSQTSSSSGSFSLPVEVNLKQLSLPQISLGPSLSGKEEMLSAEANAALTRAGIRGQASVRDLSKTAASASLAVQYDANAQTLALDGKAEEPRGGVIAGLLRLPDQPALGFSIKGDGALSNWQGKAAASVEGVPVVNLDAGIRKSVNGPIELALKGAGLLTRFCRRCWNLCSVGGPISTLRSPMTPVAFSPSAVARSRPGRSQPISAVRSPPGVQTISGPKSYRSVIVPSSRYRWRRMCWGWT